MAETTFSIGTSVVVTLDVSRDNDLTWEATGVIAGAAREDGYTPVLFDAVADNGYYSDKLELVATTRLSELTPEMVVEKAKAEATKAEAEAEAEKAKAEYEAWLETPEGQEAEAIRSQAEYEAEAQAEAARYESRDEASFWADIEAREEETFFF